MSVVYPFVICILLLTNHNDCGGSGDGAGGGKHTLITLGNIGPRESKRKNTPGPKQTTRNRVSHQTDLGCNGRDQP